MKKSLKINKHNPTVVNAEDFRYRVFISTLEIYLSYYLCKIIFKVKYFQERLEVPFSKN